MSKTTAYSNHIKNDELEDREVFERETEKNPLSRKPDLVTPLHDNQLTRSTDSSKNEERHKLEVNPDLQPSSLDSSSKTSSSDSRSKKKKCDRKKNQRKHRKDDFVKPIFERRL